MHDSQLREAKNALDRLSDDPAAKELAREREMAAWNYEHTLHSTRVENTAELLLRALELRRLPISDSQRERILSCTDLGRLERWFDRAHVVSSAEELFA